MSFSHVERAIRLLLTPVIANCLGNCQDVRFGKRAFQGCAAMSTGAEADHLVAIFQVRMALKIGGLKASYIDEHLFGCGLARQGRNSAGFDAPEDLSEVPDMISPSRCHLWIRQWRVRLAENLSGLATL